MRMKLCANPDCRRAWPMLARQRYCSPLCARPAVLAQLAKNRAVRMAKVQQRRHLRPIAELERQAYQRGVRSGFARGYEQALQDTQRVRA